MASAAKYAHEDAGESERPLRVCAEAGRKCVRNIQQYPILSVEWVALVDSLKQLTRLVQLEGRMPNNTKVSEAAGRNQDSDGTLWDQEAHENAIRILVEEAKVNLCLRMMSDYKKWQYDPAEKQRTMTEAMQTYDFNEVQMEQKCRMFEESLGVLLMKAFMHVETLQLMDIPMLIEHCCLVFQNAAMVPKPADGSAAKTQEYLVTWYFHSLMKHSEDLNNGELLANAREKNLIHLAAQHTLSHAGETQKEVLVTAMEAFAAMADNEDFRTIWTSFFVDPHTGAPDPARKAVFVGPGSLELTVCSEVLATYPDKRRELRPLLDFFRTVERGI
jgi:hypothetical protein